MIGINGKLVIQNDTLGVIFSFDGVATDVTSDPFDISNYGSITIHVIGSSITKGKGAIFGVEHSLDGDNWVLEDDIKIDEDGTFQLRYEGPRRFIRTSLTNYQDGSFTSLIYATT